MDTFIEDLLIMAIYLGPLFGALAACGLLSDYVMPHCPRLLHFIERILDIDLEGGFDDE